MTQEAAIEEALSPKNPDAGPVDQFGHALQWDSAQLLSSKRDGFAVSMPRMDHVFISSF